MGSEFLIKVLGFKTYLSSYPESNHHLECLPDPCRRWIHRLEWVNKIRTGNSVSIQPSSWAFVSSYCFTPRANAGRCHCGTVQPSFKKSNRATSQIWRQIRFGKHARLIAARKKKLQRKSISFLRRVHYKSSSNLNTTGMSEITITFQWLFLHTHTATQGKLSTQPPVHYDALSQWKSYLLNLLPVS